jgi:hypothetical protein
VDVCGVAGNGWDEGVAVLSIKLSHRLKMRQQCFLFDHFDQTLFNTQHKEMRIRENVPRIRSLFGQYER